MANESPHQRILRLRVHSGADLLFGQLDGKLRRVAFQFHARGLAGGGDFLFRVELHFGDLRGGVLAVAEALGFGFLLRFAPQRRDFVFQVGEPEVDCGCYDG